MYENALFIAEDDITTFLKYALDKRHVNNHVQESNIMAVVKIKCMEGGCWILLMEQATDVDMSPEI